ASLLTGARASSWSVEIPDAFSRLSTLGPIPRTACRSPWSTGRAGMSGLLGGETARQRPGWPGAVRGGGSVDEVRAELDEAGDVKRLIAVDEHDCQPVQLGTG